MILPVFDRYLSIFTLTLGCLSCPVFAGRYLRISRLKWRVFYRHCLSNQSKVVAQAYSLPEFWLCLRLTNCSWQRSLLSTKTRSSKPGIDIRPGSILTRQISGSNHSSALLKTSPAEQALERDFSRCSMRISEAWDRAKHCSQRPDVLQRRADDARDFLSPMMGRLRAREPSAGEEWSDLLSSIEFDLLKDLDHWHAEEAELQPADKDSGYSSTRDTIRSNLIDIGRCVSIVRDEKEFVQSPAFKVLFDPKLLVSGEWGTGKTHLLCDVTQGRIRS